MISNDGRLLWLTDADGDAKEITKRIAAALDQLSISPDGDQLIGEFRGEPVALDIHQLRRSRKICLIAYVGEGQDDNDFVRFILERLRGYGWSIHPADE